MRRLNALITACLVLAVLAAVAGIVYLGQQPEKGEQFTEFYVLDSGGKAQEYPISVVLGDSAQVILGIVNREGQPAEYRVEVLADDRTVSALEVGMLDDGKKWELATVLVPTAVGQDQRWEFLLYKNSQRTEQRLRLLIDVGRPEA